MFFSFLFFSLFCALAAVKFTSSALLKNSATKTCKDLAIQNMPHQLGVTIHHHRTGEEIPATGPSVLIILYSFITKVRSNFNQKSHVRYILFCNESPKFRRVTAV